MGHLPVTTRRLAAATPLARGLVLVLVGLGAVQDLLRPGGAGPVAAFVLAAACLGLVHGAAGWWTTRWWLTPEELRIDTGVLRRRSRRVRVDQVLEVDVLQPLAARLLGLVQVRLDVAGSWDGETLSYLHRAEAAELEAVLTSRRPEYVDRVDGEVEAEDDSVLELARVTPARQVAALATSPAAVALLGLAPVLAWADPLVVGEPLGGLGLDPGGWSELVLGPVLGALAVVLGRDLVEGWGLRVTEDRLGLHVSRGLLDVSQRTLTTHRLQGVCVTEPLLWRAVGWARLQVSTAGAPGAASGPDTSTVLSVGDRDTVWALASRLLDHDVSDVRLAPAPRRSRVLTPARLGGLWAVQDGRVVGSRSGWWVRRTHLVPHARVQSVRIRQGPLQRVLDLATVVVDSPRGPVRVVARHRRVAEAEAFLDVELEAARLARLVLPCGTTGDLPVARVPARVPAQVPAQVPAPEPEPSPPHALAGASAG